MQRTTAPNSSAGAFIDEVASPYSPGTTLVAADLNAHQEELAHAIEDQGITLSGGDLYLLSKAIKKASKENSHFVGELFPMLDYKVASPWNVATPDAYFPAYCLSAPDPGTANPTKTFTTAQAPDAVPYLRGIRASYNRGVAGEVGAFSVTNWAIAANVAALTFANTTDVVAILAALAEENAVHGSFTNWMAITLASAIGSITAGDYAITGINTGTRTITFAFVASNGSGAGAWTAEVYPFRVPGAATSARIFALQGRTLVAANDSAGEVVAGLRRRDRLQGHYHGRLASGLQFYVRVSSGGALSEPGAGTTLRTDATTGDPTADGSGNGIPRTGPTTDPRALGVHYFLHLGRLIA